jgi:hypothetical protein
MIYCTTRERRKKPQTGAFTCTMCGTEVLSWSDTYEFSDWLMVTKPPTSVRRRDVRASVGR